MRDDNRGFVVKDARSNLPSDQILLEEIPEGAVFYARINNRQDRLLCIKSFIGVLALERAADGVLPAWRKGCENWDRFTAYNYQRVHGRIIVERNG